MPNLHKAERNAEILRLFDGGRGFTHHQIAEKFGMTESAVSMVIYREKKRARQTAEEVNNDGSK